MTLENIRETAKHYQSEYYDILTLTANEVDCGVIRVCKKKIKNELGQASKSILNKILEKTYETSVNSMK